MVVVARVVIFCCALLVLIDRIGLWFKVCIVSSLELSIQPLLLLVLFIVIASII